MTNNYFISMQKGFLALMSAALLFSCSSIEPFDASELVESQEKIAFVLGGNTTFANARQEFNVCGNAKTVRLIAGKTQDVGTVSSYNDNDNIYVTVAINPDLEGEWFIRKAHLFIGNVSLAFESGVGKKKDIINPAPGKFPLQAEFPSENNTGVSLHRFTIPIGSELAKDFGTFDIALHADLIKVLAFEESNGLMYATSYKSEGAWGEGEVFSQKGNWAMHFSFNATECSVSCDPDWNRNNIVVSSNGDQKLTDELKTIFYEVDTQNKNVGIVELNRGGGTQNGYTFTAKFTPNDGVEFESLGMCVVASDVDKCETDFTIVKNESGDILYYLIEMKQLSKAASATISLSATTASVCD